MLKPQLLSSHSHSLSLCRQLKMAPALQKPAPEFKATAVVNGSFKEISLEDYKGKYLIVFFYPLDL